MGSENISGTLKITLLFAVNTCPPLLNLQAEADLSNCTENAMFYDRVLAVVFFINESLDNSIFLSIYLSWHFYQTQLCQVDMSWEPRINLNCPIPLNSTMRKLPLCQNPFATARTLFQFLFNKG